MPCSRVGCGGYAVALFCFDGRAALVWLDPLDPDRGTGAGVLCARHADALTPPRGWHLQDRRTPSPRLWDDRPPMVIPAAPPTSNMRSPAVARTFPPPTDPLPFDDEPAHHSGTETRPVVNVDDLLDAHTPLLARAFTAAGSVPERGVEV
ncbi:MAG: DUF3499 family protein [Acidimicrobiia bacterium]